MKKISAKLAYLKLDLKEREDSNKFVYERRGILMPQDRRTEDYYSGEQSS